MAQTHTQTHTHTNGHGDSMTNSAQWGRVGEKQKKYKHLKGAKNGQVNIVLNTNLADADVDCWIDVFSVLRLY